MTEIVGHHRIGRIRGGDDFGPNIMRVDRKLEQKMHCHEGVRIFHEKVIHALEWDGPVLVPEAREKIMGVIQEMGPEMYERSAVKNFDKFAWNFDKRKGLYVPKPYIEGQH